MMNHSKTTLNELDLLDRYLIQALAIEQTHKINNNYRQNIHEEKCHRLMSKLIKRKIVLNKASLNKTRSPKSAFEIIQIIPENYETRNQLPLENFVFKERQPAKFYAQTLNNLYDHHGEQFKEKRVYVTRRIT